MSPEHEHGVNNKGSQRNIRTAFFLNISFTLVEIVGGFFTNSVAIISDAVHDFGDSVSLGLAWYFQNKSEQGPDRKFTYGYKRYSVLGALINAIILAVGSGFILWEAISRFFEPEEVHPEGMILLAILGVIVNGLAVFKLRQGNSINEKVISLHLLEDVLGWIAVLIGSILLLFWDLPWIDPLLSILIATYIIRGIIKNMRRVVQIILQRTPTNVSFTAIEDYLNTHNEIREFSDIHIWSLDGEFNIMTVNITLKSPSTVENAISITHEIKAHLKTLNIQHCTIELMD